MSERLTHLDEAGAARMVDVSGKDVTAREAVAGGRITMSKMVSAATDTAVSASISTPVCADVRTRASMS